MTSSVGSSAIRPSIRLLRGWIAWLPILLATSCAGDYAEDPPRQWFNAMEGEHPSVSPPRENATADLPSPASPELDFSTPADPHRRVRFERVHIEGVTDRAIYAEDIYENGSGIALLDFDGDGDLDMFIGAGRRGAAACLFENRSEPGAFSFSQHTCFPEIIWAAGGFGIDVEQDGVHELVITGPGSAQLISIENDVRTDLLGVAVARECAAGAVAGYDIDLDGRLDIMIGCHLNRRLRSRLGNLALVQTDDGWERVTGIGGTIENDNTLGLAVIDVDEDGLLDLFVINDTFSSPAIRHLLSPPGAFWLGCDATETCVNQEQLLLETPERWGSFMGAGNLHIDGIGDGFFLSDWGPNRLVVFDGGVGRDYAESVGLGIGFVEPGVLPTSVGWDGELPYFSWGVAVDDFDFDGRDDIFVAQGIVTSFSNEAAYEAHVHFLGLQTAPASFDVLTTIDGIAVSSRADAYPADHPTTARGVAKADLDGDGSLEIIIAPQAGYVQIYSEVAALEPLPPRCTIRPHNWAVPAFGVGYAVAGNDGVFRRRDVGGQLLTGTSPWVVGPERSGTFRFPSGYEMEFDCGDETSIDLVEPEWIHIEQVDGRVRVALDRDVEELEIYARTEDRLTGMLRRSDGPTAEFSGGGLEAIMLRVDGRWIARWWDLE